MKRLDIFNFFFFQQNITIICGGFRIKKNSTEATPLILLPIINKSPSESLPLLSVSPPVLTVQICQTVTLHFIMSHLVTFSAETMANIYIYIKLYSVFLIFIFLLLCTVGLSPEGCINVFNACSSSSSYTV